MSQNGQSHFKNLAAFAAKIFKVCQTILGHYALKGLNQSFLQNKSMKQSHFLRVDTN